MIQSVFLLLCILFLHCGLLFSSPSINLKADVFELDGNNNNILASGNIVVQQKDIKLYGDYATYDQDSQVVYIPNGVKLVKGEMVLLCDQVYVNFKTEKIEIIDDIFFTYKDIKGNATYGIYSENNKQLFLTGNPIIQQGQDRLKGRSIIVDVEKGKITTKGDAKVMISLDKFGQSSQNEAKE